MLLTIFLVCLVLVVTLFAMAERDKDSQQFGKSGYRPKLPSPINDEDYEAMYDILMQELLKAGAPSNYLDYLRALYGQTKPNRISWVKGTEYSETGETTITLDKPLTPEDMVHLDYKRHLKDLTEEDFNRLKASGMLWEFYPEAPEFYRNIKKG